MRRLLTLLAALALVAAACSSTDTDGDDSTATDQTTGDTTPGAAASPASQQDGPSWLFVIEAEGGTAEVADGSGSITLTGVDPMVVAFTDRPAREVRTETPQEFVDAWGERGFAEDPPNAALDTDGEVVVVELTEPSVDPAAGTLGFSVTVLDGVGAGGREATTDELPATLGATTLFVDDAPAPGTLAIVQVEYEGEASPVVLFDQGLATPADGWVVDVEAEGGTVNIAPDEGATLELIATGQLRAVVDIPVVLGDDGSITGIASELDEGDEMTLRLVEPTGPDVTVSSSQPTFTLTPEGS